jgi:hypothetical protein
VETNQNMSGFCKKLFIGAFLAADGVRADVNTAMNDAGDVRGYDIIIIDLIVMVLTSH